VTNGAISRAKLQSNHHHQQTNTQPYTGRMSFLSPNQQCQSTEGKYMQINNTGTKYTLYANILPSMIEEIMHSRLLVSLSVCVCVKL